LKKSTDLTVNTSVGSCKGGGIARASTEPAASATNNNQCQTITTQGCTNPARPFQHITLTYTGPDGNPIYHDVVTDQNGCFQDFLVNAKPGSWKVETQYPGTSCNAQTSGPTQTVTVSTNGNSGGGGGIPPGLREHLWYSLHVGANFPTGSFARSYNPGPSITADLEYQVNQRLSIEVMYGFHFFHSVAGTASAAGPDLYYRNLSFNARAYLPFSWARLYVQAGPGAYFPNFGSTVSGVDLGLGFSFPILTNLKAEVGSDFHYVDPTGARRFFFDNKIGIAFRF